MAFKLTNEHLIYGGLGVVIIGGGYYLWTHPAIIKKLMGVDPDLPNAPPADQGMELEEAEQKGLLAPYGPTGSGGPQTQTPFAIGGSGPVGNQGPFGSIGGPVAYPQQGMGVGGGAFGFEGAQPSRCPFRPSDLVEATVQTARQYVRIIDWPVTPIANTIPRLQSCYYREIANFINAGPTNPVYFAVEQVACAISGGAPFPVLNSKSLIAAQIAKKHINQGNCYNQTLAPVPKRFDPVPVIGTRRARALRAKKMAQARAMRAQAMAYANYASEFT